LASQKLQIGTVLRPHGVRGLLRVRGSQALGALTRLYVGEQLFVVERITAERGDFLLALQGVQTREAADALRGAAVCASRDDLPPLEAGELYAADLIGCQVFDLAGNSLGQVQDTFPSGAHEVLVVGAGAAEFMLPLVDVLVPSIDIDARRIICDPPPGLVDLTPGGAGEAHED
jgi:16S rRNA processing protein RimM